MKANCDSPNDAFLEEARADFARQTMTKTTIHATLQMALLLVLYPSSTPLGAEE